MSSDQLTLDVVGPTKRESWALSACLTEEATALPQAGTCATYTLEQLGFFSQVPSRFLENAWPWFCHVSIGPWNRKTEKSSPLFYLPMFHSLSLSLHCSVHGFRCLFFAVSSCWMHGWLRYCLLCAPRHSSCRPRRI